MHWLQSSTTSKSRTKSVVVSQISMKCPTDWELQISNVRCRIVTVEAIIQKSFNNVKLCLGQTNGMRQFAYLFNRRRVTAAVVGTFLGSN